jgi:hypothetical protein
MRFEHWERRLDAVVEMYGRVAFDWGRYDCCLFAADAVWALAANDPAARWRKAYADEAGAVAIVSAAGGLASLVEASLATIGPHERIAPSFAQRGDPVLFEAPALTRNEAATFAFGSENWTASLGVTLGESFACKTPTGIARLPIKKASMAWAIR